MKLNRITKLWTLPLMAGAMAASSAVAQQASTTEWTAGPESPGDWGDSTWTAGVPVADSLAGILNGGIVGVTAATATMEQLHLSGGSTLNIGALLGIEGTNLIVNPEPDPATPATGLIVNQGTLNVTAGGDLRVNVGGDFVIGKDAVGVMSMGLNGAITTDRRLALGSGATGSGTFTQTGGTLTHSGEDFKVGGWGGTGQLDLSGGELNVNQLRMPFGSNAPATVNQTGGDIVATSTGPGTVVLGWNGSAGGNATYNLSDGTLTTNNRIRMGVGANGPRTHLFNQIGGEVYVGGGINNGRIDIGENAVNTCTYSISDGLLTTEGRILCGYTNDGTGILNMSGYANVDLFGLFVGNNATNTGTVNVSDEAQVLIREFEVRNGSVTQSGEFSLVDVLTRLYVGTAQTVTQSATYTLTDGTLKLPGTNIVGLNNTGNATFNIAGGTITTTDRLRVGVTTAGGTLTPTNMVNQTGGDVTIAGRLDLGENPGPTNIYQISGGSLTTTGNILVGYWNDGTGTFTVSGTAEVDTPSVVMGESAGTIVNGAEGTVNLNGGTLTTNQIKVGLGFTANQTLNLNGGTIRAKSDGAILISGNVTTASLLSGGITFDTAGLAASTAAVMTGPGGLTKTGTGTLTVNNVQAYTGDTTVEKGTLVLTQPYLADNGDVYLTTGAVLDLSYAGGAATDTIGALFIDLVTAFAPVVTAPATVTTTAPAPPRSRSMPAWPRGSTWSQRNNPHFRRCRTTVASHLLFGTTFRHGTVHQLMERRNMFAAAHGKPMR